MRVVAIARFLALGLLATTTHAWFGSNAEAAQQREFLESLEASCTPRLGERGFSALLTGVRRSTVFWSAVVPLVVDYTLTSKMKDADTRKKRLEQLHTKYAPRIARLTLRLRGMFVKSAQQIASLGPIIPPAYVEALSPLQHKVPAKPLEAITGILEAELGRPVSEIFASIESEPLGAATIGQAHRATLLDGREVVVKVQYPEVQTQFKADVNALYAFANLPLWRGYVPVDELVRVWQRELDFRCEAAQAGRMQDGLGERFPRVATAGPIRGLVTERVFVMQRVPGRTLRDRIEQHTRSLALLQGVNETALRQHGQAALVAAARGGAAYSAMSRLRLLGAQLHAHVHNALRLDGAAAPPRFVLDPGWVWTQLVHVHAYQALAMGRFNVDPHAGNILLADDGGLGLVDFGMLGELTRAQRHELAMLTVALAAGDAEAVVRLYDRMGFRVAAGAPYMLYFYAKVHHDSAIGLEKPPPDVRLEANFFQNTKNYPIAVFPDHLNAVVRMTSILMGIGWSCARGCTGRHRGGLRRARRTARPIQRSLCLLLRSSGRRPTLRSLVRPRGARGEAALAASERSPLGAQAGRDPLGRNGVGADGARGAAARGRRRRALASWIRPSPW